MAKTKPVIPRELAVRDVEEILEHYLREGASETALAFIDALERTYARIGRHPAAGSPRYDHELSLPGLRCATLLGFPQVVFYIEREDHVDVWRVLDGRREIPAWMRSSDSG